MLATWDRIRSPAVLRILAPIVRKMLRALGNKCGRVQIKCDGAVDRDEVKGILSAMCSSAYRLMKNVAEGISRLAQRWGNNLACKWAEDRGFIKYLIMMNLPQNDNPCGIITIKL